MYFARWKFITVAVVLALGLLYSLPNLFGEAPAVQIGAARPSGQIDQALLGRVEGVLKGANLAPASEQLDAASLKVTFPDTDAQIKARDLVAKQLGPDYTVALNLLSNSPKWLPSLGALPMYLGLDLRGGVYFLLEVDIKGALTAALDRTLVDIRTTLRDQKLPLPVLGRDGATISLKFRDADARTRSLPAIQNALQDLTFTPGADPLTETGTFIPAAAKRLQDGAVQQNIITLRNRVNELGVAEPIVQQQGPDRIVVELAGVQDTARAKEILGRTARLEIRMVDEERADQVHPLPGGRIQAPPGDEVFYDREGRPIPVARGAVLTGDRITNAQAGFDQNHEAVVNMTLDGYGARVFQQVTRENVGKRLAILLLEQGRGEIVTAPVIRSEIDGGRVQISGRMTVRDANDTALLLRAGALAAPMSIIEERTVGPSLGAANIQAGVNSILYGFTAITVFMCIYYRLFGVVSIIALAVNVLLLVGVLSVMQATLTLPGIAAIALTVGMAIDANVLINERIREELRAGRIGANAIHVGYERAFGTIFDSNVTQLIAGIALFAFGSGPIRGFAVVLCLGIVTSIFSAVMVSRAMVSLIYGRRPRMAAISI